MIELVPQTCWYSNIRDHVSTEEWNILKRSSYQKAKYLCEICGEKGDKHPVECHEIWEYDDKNKIQKLNGLISLCPSCHQVKHIGLAERNGKLEEAMKHFEKINKTNRYETLDYIKKVFLTWNERSKHKWILDFQWLKENYNIELKSKRT